MVGNKNVMKGECIKDVFQDRLSMLGSMGCFMYIAQVCFEISTRV